MDGIVQPCCIMKYFPQTTSARREVEEERLEEEKAHKKVGIMYYVCMAVNGPNFFGFKV